MGPVKHVSPLNMLDSMKSRLSFIWIEITELLFQIETCDVHSFLEIQTTDYKPPSLHASNFQPRPQIL